MNIALIGRGKTGVEIENLLNQSVSHQLISVSTGHTGLDLTGIRQADVVIDFSVPEAVVETIQTVSGLGKHMVIGTTGWYSETGRVEKIVNQNNTGLIYGQNFSIGTNIFFQLVALAARLTSRFGNYDVYGIEVHHSGKQDSPSGTALKIAEEIIANFPVKKSVQTDRLNRKIEPDELHFASVRGGRNPGMHQVVFDSETDSITLADSAHSRKGFASGAVLAAEFIFGKTGFYSFDALFSQQEGVLYD